ncbi:MAG: efflux RND transporter periplasmic adaptor subunit [Candidatus Eisenbacteria bacterium]
MHQPPPGAAFMNTVRWVLFAGLSLLALISIASWVAWQVGLHRDPDAARAKHTSATLYRCPMHPNYTSDKAGDCPICGMKLEAVEPEDGRSHDTHAGDVPGLVTVQIPAARTQLLGVRRATVQRGSLGDGAPLVGFVSPDESRLRRVQLRVSGWVQSVAMNRTGESVRAGQPMLSLYSPELHQSEQEYLIALGDGQGMAGHDAGAHDASRERLRLLGVPDDEVARLERERTPSSRLALKSPVTGTVLERNVVEGQYVGADTPLFTIADLSRVWVLLDLYEIDMGRVRVGDRARFTADGLPGRVFNGAIDFIYPTVSSETRTLKARLTLDNRDGMLRPGMYGQVDVASRKGVPALMVPSEAVINTGEVSYVFLARGDGRYEPRRVWTGRGDGDKVTVLRGLAFGDTVVASASFLIDSESRLKAAIAGINGGAETAKGAVPPSSGTPPPHQH